MKPTVKNIVTCFEKHVPKNLAEDWDNVGLQIGDFESKVEGILTTLDVTEEIVDYAIENGFNLIFSHHPMIFKGIKSIDLNSYQGRMIGKLIKNDISVYSAHTNFDIAENGLNDLAAKRLELRNVKGLCKSSIEEYFKLVVFVPKTHSDIVRNALGEAGAGQIGDYSNCSFSIEGTGRFKPLEGANPYIGAVDTFEEVVEERIEVIVPSKLVNKAVAAMKKVHPYEEVAYESVALAVPKIVNFIGRIGELPEPMTSEEFALHVRKAFPNGKVRLAGGYQELIKKVALCTGSGASFIKTASSKGAQAYVTGDLKYHEAQQAKELGILVADAGHFGTEEIAAEGFVELLQNICPKEYLEEITIAKYDQQKDFFLDL